MKMGRIVFGKHNQTKPSIFYLSNAFMIPINTNNNNRNQFNSRNIARKEKFQIQEIKAYFKMLNEKMFLL